MKLTYNGGKKEKSDVQKRRRNGTNCWGKKVDLLVLRLKFVQIKGDKTSL